MITKTNILSKSSKIGKGTNALGTNIDIDNIGKYIVKSYRVNRTKTTPQM